jgi:TPR repeat protein
MSSSENLLTATNWLKMAAKQDHEQAKSVLADIESEMEQSLRG